MNGKLFKLEKLYVQSERMDEDFNASP